MESTVVSDLRERITRDKLVALRVSIARLAQTVGIQTNKLPVLDEQYDNHLTLKAFAAEHEEGWHALIGAVIGQVEELQAQRGEEDDDEPPDAEPYYDEWNPEESDEPIGDDWAAERRLWEQDADNVPL